MIQNLQASISNRLIQDRSERGSAVLSDYTLQREAHFLNGDFWPKGDGLLWGTMRVKADFQGRAYANIVVVSGIGDGAFEAECDLRREAHS